MNAINNLGKDITIILIAHRLNTVKNCDTIFKLEKVSLCLKNFNELMAYDKNPTKINKISLLKNWNHCSEDEI